MHQVHQPTKIWSGGKDKAVEVMCNLKKDIAELKIYNNSNYLQKTVTSPSTYVREKFTGKTNGYSYSYKFKTTDIVGNESEYTTSITEKAGVEIGQIVYLPENDYEKRFASFNVYTEQNPIDVICNKTDLKTVRVYRLTEVDGFAWGGIARPSSGDYDWAHNHFGLVNLLVKAMVLVMNEQTHTEYRLRLITVTTHTKTITDIQLTLCVR